MRDSKSVASGRKRGAVNAKQLAKKWSIPLDRAERTLQATTQKGVRDLSNVTGTKRMRSLDKQFSYKHLDAMMFCDTIKGPCKSLDGNLHAAVYATKFGWCSAKPMQAKSDVDSTLESIFQDVGVPRELVTDGAKEFVMEGSAFRKKAKKAGARCSSLEMETQKHSAAEAGVRELKRNYKKAKEIDQQPCCSLGPPDPI